MAENNVTDDLKTFREEIDHGDKQIRKDYIALSATLNEYTKKQHTKEEDRQIFQGVEDTIESLQKNISDEKEMLSELRAVDIKVLKKYADLEPNSFLRDVPKRSKMTGHDDSGCFSANVDSRLFTDVSSTSDSRLFTDNNLLVATPTENAQREESEEQKEIGTE